MDVPPPAPPLTPKPHAANSSGTEPPGGRSGGLFGTALAPLQAFLRLEAASSILLLASAIAAMVWANVSGHTYRAVIDYPLMLGVGPRIATFTLRALINDGLMAVFFLVVGMEIKRELVVGELNSPAKAALPAVAAIGGMVVPAAIFVAFTAGSPGQRGWGIPMATDIAFCIGALKLLKERVPRPLLVFVTALAIFDDIGGILVIALFYGHGLSLGWLLVAAACCALLFGLNRRFVTNGLGYAVLGSGLWYALHHGGIHATIAGVITGLMIPARPRRSSRDVIAELAQHVEGLAARSSDDDLQSAEILMIEEKLEDFEAPLNRFVHALHPLVAFGIMPVFALVNAGVSVRGLGWSEFATPVALGSAVGLFVGKQIGVFGFSWLAIRARLSPIPGGAPLAKLFGVAVTSGIGFTVALFIAALAYPDAPALLDQAKLGILIGSFAAGIVGLLLLRLTGRPTASE